MSTTPETPDAVDETLDGQQPEALSAETVTTGEPVAAGEDTAVAAGEDTAVAAGEDAAVADASPSSGAARGRRAAKTEDLVREGEIAADFLEALLDIADLAGDLEVDIDGNRAAVAIVDSEDGVAPRRLVGPGGQVLDALQELTRLAVQAETGERSWLMLDVAGHRSDRKAELVRQARTAIEEVKQTGRRAELEPMSAFERKVVHDEVLAAGLVSESEGADPSRYVVILPSA
ncbi:Jag family protein [Ornithinimicrobium panacihumi]|uniref:Jag family protein n=1 Tax=Ornithinimicrobium panacihumi TaxID=2008449 RepID=UPI003F8933F7